MKLLHADLAPQSLESAKYGSHKSCERGDVNF